MTSDRSRRGHDALWRMTGIVYARRWFIISVTGIGAVLAVVVSLLLPNWYRANARLLMPEGGGGLSSTLLRNLPAAATALLGGGPGGDYMRYLSILTSRSVMTAAVDSFGLVTVYELEDSPAPEEDAVEQLRSLTDFEIDLEYQFLSVSVDDKEPTRAAAMANFFVRRLNETNARLASATAANYRSYVEKRYFEALAAMDSLLDAQKQFQQEYGVYDLTTQTESFFRQVAELRAQALAAEIQYEVAAKRLGPDNAQVEALGDLYQAANEKYEDALSGSERLMPVSQAEVPEVARTFASLELDRRIQVAILEILGPMFEQARLAQEQESEAVQVIDYAVVPQLKNRPRRSVIVILTTISVFMLTVVFVLIRSWLARRGRELYGRLGAEAAAARRQEDSGSPVAE